MYKTGDICRWTEDGDIQILGRVDDMVKVKGYRIELDEVSAAVSRHPSVVSATVLVKNEMLVAFVTPASLVVDDLRDFVLDILPAYMVPSQFILLESLPINGNGKVFLFFSSNSYLLSDIILLLSYTYFHFRT